jgi:hypothetical protein
LSAPDSYFASVAIAQELKRCGLRVIGEDGGEAIPPGVSVCVGATRPWGPLRTSDAYSAGVRLDGTKQALFIASGCSLQEGAAYSRDLGRQVDEQDEAPPERVHLFVKQPIATDLYNSTCGSIDQHNRHQQDTLMLERKVGTEKVKCTFPSICSVFVHYNDKFI